MGSIEELILDKDELAEEVDRQALALRRVTGERAHLRVKLRQVAERLREPRSRPGYENAVKAGYEPSYAPYRPEFTPDEAEAIFAVVALWERDNCGGTGIDPEPCPACDGSGGQS